MSASIQATMASFRRKDQKSVPLPNLSTILIGASNDFYYGTRGVSSRMYTLQQVLEMSHDPSIERLTCVEISIAGSFRSLQTHATTIGFTATEFFYTQQARTHEIHTISDAWRKLVQREAVEQGRRFKDSNTDWAKPGSFMLKHPSGAPLLFAHYPKLKVLGLPMMTVFNEPVMVTMFRKGDARSLIRWVKPVMATIDVVLDTPDGQITLPQREEVDPRYRKRAA